MDLMDGVFEVTEYCFDINVLRELVRDRLDQLGVEIVLRTEVSRVIQNGKKISVEYTAAGSSCLRK